MDIKVYLNKAADHLILPHTMLGFFQKKRSRTSLAASFFALFLKKIISLVLFN